MHLVRVDHTDLGEVVLEQWQVHPGILADVHVVVAGLLHRSGEVLLCHRSADREWCADVWDLPGGHVEPGEAPASALARELREELGVEVRVEGGPAWTLQTADMLLDVWLLDSWLGEPVNAAPEEHDQVRWWPVAQALGLELAEPSYAGLFRRVLPHGQ